MTLEKIDGGRCHKLLIFVTDSEISGIVIYITLRDMSLNSSSPTRLSLHLYLYNEGVRCFSFMLGLVSLPPHLYLYNELRRIVLSVFIRQEYYSWNH